MPKGFNGFESRVIDVAREIDTRNFRADMRRQFVYAKIRYHFAACAWCQHVGHALRNCVATQVAKCRAAFLIVARIVVRCRDVGQ